MGEPEKEGFGEAQPGEAQADDPAVDPEMIDSPLEGEEGGGASGAPEELTGGLGDNESEAAEGGTESYGGEQDAEPPSGT